jgi:glutaminase
MTMNFQKILQQIYTETKPMAAQGTVAEYIPALKRADPLKYGITLQMVNRETFAIGDNREPFSIQSISKVFSFALAYGRLGTDIWQRLGREPSGTTFNSLIQLEHEKGIPRNPFINAGAIVIADILVSMFESPKDKLLNFVRKLAGNNNIGFNTEVALSEQDTGHRNYALAHFMKSFGNIVNKVDDVLDLYFHQCSIAMCTDTLASSFLFLANGGINPHDGQAILTPSQTKRLNALMLTTGLYNESGDFAFRVGMPGKSGVGGGVVAVIPGHLSMACWSPALNASGNSIASVEAMERFTTYTKLSVF